MYKFRIHRTLVAALVVLLIATPAEARRLMELDGIELRGTARVLTYGAATCHVLEEKYSEEDYARLKDNEGQPLDLWQLDFSVYNGSGKALDHLIARYRIESPWPPCTNWSYAPGTGANEAAWDGDSGQIQRTGEPYSVSPGETVTREILLIAFHEDEPRFARWSMDYNFAEGIAPDADGQDTPAQAAAPTEQPSPTQAGTPSPAQPSGLPSDISTADTCTGNPEASACWLELDNPPRCYLWDSVRYQFRDADRYSFWEIDRYENVTVVWSGMCAGGLAEGTGEITWLWDNDTKTSQTETGQLQRGKKHGEWDERSHGIFVTKFENGTEYRDPWSQIKKGPYVHGKRHGQWVESTDLIFTHVSFSDWETIIKNFYNYVHEGSYVDGKRHGQWVETTESPTYKNFNFEDKGVYVDGKKQGLWVNYGEDGKVNREVPYVDGVEQ